MQIIPIKDKSDVNFLLIALRRKLFEALEGNKNLSYRFDAVEVDGEITGTQLILEINQNVNLQQADKFMQQLGKEITHDKGKI